MQVVDLEGKETRWKCRGKEITTDRRPRSELHKYARVLIKEKFPTLQILEEVSFSPKKGKVLYLDFYLPLRKLAFEVQGEQHFSFNSMYHTTPMDFLNQRKNDKIKKDWCDINGIDLIYLIYNQKDNWVDQI